MKPELGKRYVHKKNPFSWFVVHIMYADGSGVLVWDDGHGQEYSLYYLDKIMNDYKLDVLFQKKKDFKNEVEKIRNET
jgi:hypothetical protein